MSDFNLKQPEIHPGIAIGEFMLSDYFWVLFLCFWVIVYALFILDSVYFWVIFRCFFFVTRSNKSKVTSVSLSVDGEISWLQLHHLFSSFRWQNNGHLWIHSGVTTPKIRPFVEFLKSKFLHIPFYFSTDLLIDILRFKKKI